VGSFEFSAFIAERALAVPFEMLKVSRLPIPAFTVRLHRFVTLQASVVRANASQGLANGNVFRPSPNSSFTANALCHNDSP
jgi:hypothetical protein